MSGDNKKKPRKKSRSERFNLKGQCLIAMPGMPDPRFSRAVILVCSHSSESSMGFVLNHPVASPSFASILDELGLEEEATFMSSTERLVQVFSGGPVEQGRGFVLHSQEFSTPSSARVGDLACVTATLEILRKLASDEPPARAIMLLGYAGWAGGKLEEEIAQNSWLTLPATRQLVFETPHEQQYEAALAALGVNEATLSASAGHA